MFHFILLKNKFIPNTKEICVPEENGCGEKISAAKVKKRTSVEHSAKVYGGDLKGFSDLEDHYDSEYVLKGCPLIMFLLLAVRD